MGLSVDSTSFTLRAMERFGTLQSEVFPKQTYISTSKISVGGNQQPPGVIDATQLVLLSLSGIVNRMWYQPSYIDDSTFTSLYSYPSKDLSKFD